MIPGGDCVTSEAVPEVAVDVVMAAYNAERWLDEAISSVRAQTLPGWRLTVVDDASTDRTAEIAERHARDDRRVRVVRQLVNAGAAVARNAGVVLTSAPYLAFLDADDLWEADALNVLLDALERFPGAPGAHGYGHTIDESGRPVAGWNGSTEIGRDRPAVRGGRWTVLGPAERTGIEAFAVSCPIPTPGMVLIRRSALPAGPEPPWDRAAFPADDWLLWARITREAGGFAFVDRPVLRYRRYTGQATATGAPHLGTADRYVRRWLMEHAVDDAERALFRAGLRYEWRRTAAVRRRWMVEQAARGRVRPALRQAAHAALALGRAQIGLA